MNGLNKKKSMFDTLFSWLFSLNLLLQFPTNYGLFTEELQSSLAIYCAETLCDCQMQIPKHKEKFAFGSDGSYGTHSSKFEMGIKRLKHMVSFPILLWSSGDTTLFIFPIKEYWQSLCMLQFFIVYILKGHCDSHQVFRDIVGHFMPATLSPIFHHHTSHRIKWRWSTPALQKAGEDWETGHGQNLASVNKCPVACLPKTAPTPTSSQQCN